MYEVIKMIGHFIKEIGCYFKTFIEYLKNHAIKDSKSHTQYWRNSKPVALCRNKAALKVVYFKRVETIDIFVEGYSVRFSGRPGV